MDEAAKESRTVPDKHGWDRPPSYAEMMNAACIACGITERWGKALPTDVQTVFASLMADGMNITQVEIAAQLGVTERWVVGRLHVARYTAEFVGLIADASDEIREMVKN